ncbi:ATP-binding protein [Haliangium sp.]|uniref:ATP-binding protein n=1 Tax=Haliangium sp. TaxID=2663208 RepID=UPI003D0C7ED4
MVAPSPTDRAPGTARSLRRYLLGRLVLFIAAGAVGIVLSVRAGMDIARDSSREGRDAAAAAIARNIELEFGYARQLILAGAKRPGLIRFMAARDRVGVQAVVDIIHDETPYYRAVFAVDPNLSTLAGTPGLPPGQPFRDQLRSTLNDRGQHVSAPTESSDGEELVVVVSAAILDRGGQTLGVLVGEVAFPLVARDLVRARYGSQGFARLVTTDGTLLADPHQPTGSAVEPGLRDALARARAELAAGPNPAAPIHLRYEDDSSAAMVASLIPATDQGWYVALTQPEHEAVAKVARLRLLVSLLVGGAIGLTALFVLLVIKQVSRPIESVARVAARISSGELSARVERPAFRELATVSDAINDMAQALATLLADLDQRRRTLERRVAERTAALEQRTLELADSNRKLDTSLAELRDAETQLVDMSRLAGRAEIAANMAHNVGNVLNSLNVSAAMIRDHLRGAKATQLQRVADLLREHQGDLVAFLTGDERGRKLPSYLAKASEHLDHALHQAQVELDALDEYIDHLKHVVASQQDLSVPADAHQPTAPAELVDRALRLLDYSFAARGIEIVKDYQPTPELPLDQHRVLQILINLLRNACHAIDDGRPKEPRITVRVAHADGWLRITVGDNGCGIAAADISRIFDRGVTTRADGSGLGLHAGATSAADMDGTLSAHSDGPGAGAVFTLDLPTLS